MKMQSKEQKEKVKKFLKKEREISFFGIKIKSTSNSAFF